MYYYKDLQGNLYALLQPAPDLIPINKDQFVKPKRKAPEKPKVEETKETNSK